MCFPFSWGKRETHKQNSQEISGKGRESPGIIPGQSRENFVFVFACLLVFSLPYLWVASIFYFSDDLFERPCVSQEGGSMLLRREGGFSRATGEGS